MKQQLSSSFCKIKQPSDQHGWQFLLASMSFHTPGKQLSSSLASILLVMKLQKKARSGTEGWVLLLPFPCLSAVAGVFEAILEHDTQRHP